MAKKTKPPAPLPGAEDEETKTELVAIADLKDHPENYKRHPDDQLAHIAETLRVAGAYKNIVIARDNTVLMGHGVKEAALRAGRTRISARRLDVAPDDPRALSLVAADNEIANLAEVDDRKLTELLKNVMSAQGLLGTGLDDAQLAALAMVSRPASEIGTINEAAAWAGMPEFDAGKDAFKVVVNLETEKDRETFLKKIGVKIFGRKEGKTWSCWWPPRAEKDDLNSVKFVGSKAARPAAKEKRRRG